MATHHLSWLEAGVVGAMQGVSELFPVSSLGHSVLLPAVVGGSWARDLNVASAESPFAAEQFRQGDPDVNQPYVDERITGPVSDARIARSCSPPR